MASASTYESLIDADIEFMHVLQDWFQRQPAINSFMRKIVNKHPWLDICVSNWILAVLGVAEIGFQHFWIVSLNLILAVGTLASLLIHCTLLKAHI